MKPGTTHSPETKAKIGAHFIGRRPWNKRDDVGLCRDCNEAPAQSIKRPYCKPCRNARERRAYKPHVDRNRQLKNLYGVDLEWYRRKYLEQDGKCAICGEARDKLVVDHCHATGQVRDLLCGRCNIGVGHIEREGFMSKALKYLENHARKGKS